LAAGTTPAPTDLPGFEETYRQETRDLLVSRLRLALGVGIFMYPAFWLLDVVVTEEHRYLFLAIRLVITALALATVLYTYGERGREHIMPLSVAMLAIPAFGISAMTVFLGGFASNYFIGNMVVLFYVGLFMPWPAGVTLLFCTLLLLSYFVPNVLVHGPSAQMVAPGFFLLGTATVTCFATQATDRVRRKELALRLRLEQANQELQRLDEAKTRFFANVSHELRTPLMLILGPLEALLSGRDDGDPGPLLRAMDANARRLLRQVNMLLNFSRLEAGRLECRFEPGRPGELLQDLVVAAGPYAQNRGITLEAEGLEDLPGTWFDAEKLETVAANLISNAMKFTPDGGRVTVRGGQKAEGIFFEVEDTGIGIPPEEQPRVFERFHQVDGGKAGKHPGTGLGLSLARELVRLHGGDILLRSEPGQGSTFRVELPVRPPGVVVDEAEAPAAATAEAAPAPAAGHRRGADLADLERGRLGETLGPTGETAPDDAPLVLVVEDNPDMRAFVARSLAPRYRVETALDGEDGLEQARRLRPDLIVSDVMMPKVDGLEMVARLREDPVLQRIPVILLTARAGIESIVQGLEQGAVDYVTKPFRLAELEARVAAQLRARAMERTLAERESRLVAVGHMTSTLAHDLKGPLTAILGRIGLMRMIAAQDPNLAVIREDLDAVERAVTRARIMIQEMVEYVRGEKVELEPEATEVAAFVGDLARDLEPSLQAAGVELIVDVAAGEGLHAEIDHARMARVLDNLVSNARDALACRDPEEGHRRIWLLVEPEDPHTIRIRVADNGPGVPSDIAGHLFQPFATAGKKHGTGLGLAIVRNLVRAHGGSIELEDQPLEGGAAFLIRLPRCRPTRFGSVRADGGRNASPSPSAAADAPATGQAQA